MRTRTLYYHLCVPDAEDEHKGDDVSYTTVAQLACFCLLALRSEALWGPELEAARRTAKN